MMQCYFSFSTTYLDQRVGDETSCASLKPAVKAASDFRQAHSSTITRGAVYASWVVGLRSGAAAFEWGAETVHAPTLAKQKFQQEAINRHVPIHGDK